VKVSLGVGKGKHEYDRRDDIKQRDSDRELKQAAMKFAKGK
jgi:tmRNA-binding protein